MSMPKSEKLSHYAIVIIAISAVVVSIWQGRISERHLEIAREHNRLTVKPYLDVFTGWQSGPSTWQIVLSNEGVGPAIVKSVDYRYNDTSYKGWDTVLKAAKIGHLRRGSVQLGVDSPFATDKELVLLGLAMTESERQRFGITVVITYESIYEDEMPPLEISF